MKLKFCFLMLALLYAGASFAQTGTIKGIVTSSDNQEVKYISVYIKGTTIGSSTDQNGKFIILKVPIGEQIVVASFVGMETEELKVVVKENQVAEVDFSIKASAQSLAEILVSGQKRRISTATKTVTPLENLPMSIQIVDKDLMQQQLIMDTRDAIKNVSGVTVTGTYNGGYTYYNSRGFWMNNWSNFRRNGMMIWNMGHHHNDNIEQIEVLKGPASVLYGDVAPGGVMNFSTKKPLNYNYRRFELRVGQYGLFRPTFDITGPIDGKGKVLYRLNTTYEKSNSFRDKVNNETVMFSPALTWKILPRLTWDIEGVYKNDERVGDPGIISPDGTFEGVKKLPVSTFLGEPSSTYTFTERNLFSTFNFQLSDHWRIRNQTYYSHTNRNPNNIYFRGSPDEQGNVARTQYHFHQYWKGWGNNFDIIGDFNTGPLRHQSLLGFDYMNNGGKWSEGIDEVLDTTINIYNPKHGIATLKSDPIIWSKFRNFYERTGIYFQDQISTLDNKLNFLIGARYNITRQGNDYTNQEDEPDDFKIPVDKLISPRFGVVYKPLKEMSVYGSYSQSYEMNGQDWINPAILITPTDAAQIEFGVKSSLLKDRLGITISAFQIDKKNVYGWLDAAEEPTIDYISWDEEGQWATYQAGHHRSRGVELDVNGKILESLSINATYAFIDAKIIEDPAYNSGNQLEGNARNSGSIWLNYAFNKTMKGLEFGYGLFYKDKFYLTSANSPGQLVNSYYSMDASVAYTFNNLTARFNVSNLTDNKGYIGSNGRYEPLWVRRAILSLAFKF